MKKIFLLFLFSLFASSSVYGLSCNGFPTFEDQAAEATIVVKGMVEDISYIPRDYDSQFCAQQGGNAIPGTYAYTISVSEVIVGAAPEVMLLTRDVYDIHCTRGGACIDMEVGKEYTLFTNDGETLTEGMCSACPYQEISNSDGNTYDPANDPECISYNDGCNICSKDPTNPSLIVCTEMACFQMGEPFCIEYANQGPSCICTMDYTPVCGTNGQTYSNACQAGCAQVEVAYTGECQFGQPGECQRGYSGKVCGVDTITYDDICDLESTGVAKAYDGECVPNPGPALYVEAPNFCTSWYDGCNECGISNGLLGACTKRACFTMNRAKCTAFEFIYLTSGHEKIIDDVIGKRLNTASQEDRERVIEKAQTKIDEINYTLSVSSFAQGSRALRDFQFLLEVLWKIDSAL